MAGSYLTGFKPEVPASAFVRVSPPTEIDDNELRAVVGGLQLLSDEQVVALIDAAAAPSLHRTMLLTAHSLLRAEKGSEFGCTVADAWFKAMPDMAGLSATNATLRRLVEWTDCIAEAFLKE